MNGSLDFAVRFWRLHGSRNPLRRACDRAEGVLAIVLVLLALVAAAFAATLGWAAASAGARRAQQEMSTRHETVAVTVEPAPHPAASVEPWQLAGAGTTVDATWTAPDGKPRVSRVAVPVDTPPGTKVPVWVDHAGNLAPTPFQPAQAIDAGVTTGLLTWLASMVASGGCYGIVHVLLDRHRYALWAREWEQFGRSASHS